MIRLCVSAFVLLGKTSDRWQCSSMNGWCLMSVSGLSRPADTRALLVLRSGQDNCLYVQDSITVWCEASLGIYRS